MTISGNQLLSALGSGVLMNDSGRAVRHEEYGLNFEEILNRVQRGEPSEIGVQLGKDLLPDDLSRVMQDRAGLAADLASLNGIEHALVDLGGSLVRLDVRNRVIDAQIEPSDGQVVDRIDGFVSMRVGQGGEDGEGGRGEGVEGGEGVDFVVTGPARVVRNASLMAALSGRGL